MYYAVLQDANDPAKQLQDLDRWAQKYPRSDFMYDRLYLYVLACSRIKPAQPSKVVHYGAPLVAKDLKTVFQDPRQILVVLYLVTFNAANLPNPSDAQLKAGCHAARELLEGLPAFFAEDRRPPNVTAADWKKSRSEMEARRRALEGSKVREVEDRQRAAEEAKRRAEDEERRKREREESARRQEGRGLDLILHTPGGDMAATESLVDYLRAMFGTDICAFVPQLAMSAGTIARKASNSST